LDSQTQQVDDLRLVALPSAVNCAEIFVQFTLAEWALQTLQDDTIRLARHLVSGSVERSDPDRPGMMTVRLRLTGNDLVVEVEADRAGPPPQGAGRRGGLATLTNGQELAWCTVALPRGVSAPSVPLPRRTRRPSPAAAELGPPDDVDDEVLRRIMFGLGGQDGH
jgi:hypothetical protein